ncbi:hypothetical protein NE237_028581 [Protea cynaroides]|uniref:Cytochrome b5 heme-binding domain-containing protein n=1 Tax=Protea cynaroides TaxID=273540 RepID=A0A9Q0GQJ0_9MAGN|nr:hypothetical protein NE237_028581 [Protea cynaroides]
MCPIKRENFTNFFSLRFLRGLGQQRDPVSFFKLQQLRFDEETSVFKLMQLLVSGKTNQDSSHHTAQGITVRLWWPGNAEVVKPNHDNEVSKLYTRSEISSHNKKTDCWIIIKDKVYDVTSYVEEHPGGDAILAHAGDDSTNGFYGPQHATRVFDMIDDFYIGDLEH